MLHNFLKIIFEDEFKLVPVDLICEILSSEDIQIDEEHQTLKAALIWLHHDAENRRKYLKRLISNVRFPFITPTAFANILEECLDVTIKNELQRLTSEIAEIQLESGERSVLKNPTKSDKELLSFWCYPRLSAKRNIYLVGGCSQKQDSYFSADTPAIKACDCYSTYLKQWQTVSNLHFARSWHGTCRLNGMIYVAGGENESVIFSSVECYDPQSNHWTLVQDMIMPRCGLGLTALASKLYAFGGWVGSEIGLTVESYNPKYDEWQVSSRAER